MVRVVSLWVEKNLVPPPNRQALDWSVILAVRSSAPSSHKRIKWQIRPEFYPGNARACPVYADLDAIFFFQNFNFVEPIGILPDSVQMNSSFLLCCSYQEVSIVSSSWHLVRGLAHSTLDTNRWQLRAV